MGPVQDSRSASDPFEIAETDKRKTQNIKLDNQPVKRESSSAAAPSTSSMTSKTKVHETVEEAPYFG